MTYVTERMNADICCNLEQLQKLLKSKADCIEIYVMKNQEGELIVTPQNRNISSMYLNEVFQTAKEYPEKKIDCYLKESDLEFEVLKLSKEMHLPNKLIYSGMVDLELIRKDKNQLPDIEVHLDIERLFPTIYQVAQSTELEEYFYDFVYYSLFQSKKYEVACVTMNHSLCVDQILYFMRLKQINCSVCIENESYVEGKLLAQQVYNITRNVMGLSR